VAVSDLIAAMGDLAAVVDRTTKSIGAMSEAAEAVAPLLKDNLIDPLADLQKVLDTFQGPALGFKQMFEQIAKSVHEGTMDINEAREAIAKLLGMLERFALADRRAGDPGKINEIIQALERFLSEMSKGGRGGRP